MKTYDVTFQTAEYTLHTQGQGTDEDSAVDNASQKLFQTHGISTLSASVMEVVEITQ